MYFNGNITLKFATVCSLMSFVPRKGKYFFYPSQFCRLWCGRVCIDVFGFKNVCVGSRAKSVTYAAVFPPVCLSKCDIPSLLSNAKLQGL